MSLRFEQYRALRGTHSLLRSLLDPKATPRVPRSVRDEARSCLKHYPILDKDGRPIFSKDPFSPPMPEEE